MKYLILGASSEVSLAFMKAHDWSPEDEIVAQYHTHSDGLEALDIPARMITSKADFSREDGIADFVKFIREQRFIPANILHAPASPVRNARLTELTWREFQVQMMIQVRSFFEVTRAVIRDMAKSGGGRIVVVLSSYSLGVPPAFLSDYVTAKYALMGLAKSLASEYAGKNILVNMISPSIMATKFVENIYSGVIAKSAEANPMKRNARPEDIASLVSYLLSEKNSFITGANIPVTGGEEF